MGLLRFLTPNVDETWHHELEKAEKFYTKVTAFEIMIQLKKRSGDWHAINAVDIMLDMHQYFYKAARIPVYVNMMETAPKKAARAKLPISDDMLVAIATKAILATYRFPRAMDAWEEKTYEDKTWSE